MEKHIEDIDSIRTVHKGTPQWRDLFYDNDPEELFWSPAFETDTLYYKGELSALLDQDRPKVLITGSRDINSNSMRDICSVMGALAENPFHPVIVSSLAYGTDTEVHRLSLELGLPTVAFLANGLDTIYPYMNRELAARMVSTPGCALISQFQEGTAPLALHFLVRNKTMAMVSDTAVIPACKAKGSALVCARLMAERRRVVYAVPGNLSNKLSEGCNALIRERTAEILCNLDDLKIISATRKSNEYRN